MTTAAQIRANQENSKLSTGPRTEDGKAASSRNHLVHGLCAADPVLPTENREKFAELLEEFKSAWTPITTHQEFLVSEMAGARWKLDRVQRMENDMFAALDDPTKAFTDKETAAGFARLEKYRAALERTYHRCLRELRVSRKDQFEPKSTELAEKKYDLLLSKLIERNLAGGLVDISGDLNPRNVQKSGS